MHYSKSVSRLVLILGAALLFIGFGAHASADANNGNNSNLNNGYQIQSARNETMKVVQHKGAPIWQDPYVKGTTFLGKVGNLSGQTVQLEQVAIKDGHKYYQIRRQGRTYGWVNANNLVEPSTYLLPYTYTSQLYPLSASSACEAASLKIALSVKGLGNDSLKSIIDNMPKSSDPNKGFTGNPYTGKPSGTIHPKGLADYANSRYNAGAVNISGASRNKLIGEIKNGNPVVFVGSVQMRESSSYHVLTIVGYRKGQFLIADPYTKKNYNKDTFWVSTGQFMKIYDGLNRPRHQRAMAIEG